MNRRELEEILRIIWTLMDMLTPYINPDSHQLKEWNRAIGTVSAVVFETEEEV